MKTSFKHVMKIFVLLLLFTGTATSQTVDLVTTPFDWQNGVASAQIHFQPMEKFGISLGGSFQSAQTTGTNFDNRFYSTGISTEIRYYPFGVRNIGLNKRMPSEKNCKKLGCVYFKKKRPPFFQGVYVAPGFRYEKTNLDYIPAPGLESPKSIYEFTIMNNAGTLHIGYMIRIFNLTLDAGYGVGIGRPTWEGPTDIFGDKFYTTTYPVKFRLEKGFRLGVGLNF